MVELNNEFKKRTRQHFGLNDDLRVKINATHYMKSEIYDYIVKELELQEPDVLSKDYNNFEKKVKGYVNYICN